MSGPAGAKPVGLLPPMHCLVAFEAVARNRQLARAAHELGLTRSALGNSIDLLEHRLRVRLIRRYAPSVELTPAGRRYLEATQEFSREIRDALYDVSPLVRAQLRISASRALGRLWLGPRLAEFMRHHPRVELVVTTTDRLDSVLGDGVDVALRYGGDAVPGTVSVPLMTDRLIAVGAIDLVKGCGPLLDVERLSALPLIEHPSMPWRAWLASMGVRDDPPPPRLCTTDLHFALNAAAAGAGVAIVPGLFAQPFIDSGRLLRVGGHAMPAKPYHAVVSESQFERIPVRALLDWLRQETPRDRRSRRRGARSGSGPD